MNGWKHLASRLGLKNSNAADSDRDIDPNILLQQMIEAERRRHHTLSEQAAAIIEHHREIQEQLGRRRDEAEKLAANARQAGQLADQAVAIGDTEKILQYRNAYEAYTAQLPITEESIQQLETVNDLAQRAADTARTEVEHSALMLQQQVTERTTLLTRLEHATTQERLNVAMRAINRHLWDSEATSSLEPAPGPAENRYTLARADSELARYSNPAGGPPNPRMPSLPGGGRSVVVIRILMGMCMSLSAILAVAAPLSGGDQGIDIAAVAAASVPAVGAVMSTVFQSELGEIANANLRRTLWVGQLLAFLAVISFVVSVALGTSGLVSEAGTVYAALASGTLGGVSLLVSNRAKEARNLALTIAMINSIEDSQLRDETRAKVALEASRISRARTLGVARGGTTP
ncbi:PspA/IM30 family protein [Nocardia brasiliensis]|uniref:PspA/IM30 family protein n=1 Tax=Nocardia brasiliensis TaxID=37326 RepID=UPI003672A548